MQAKILARTNNMRRADWLKIRQLGIGGSDAAAIAGLSRWGNAATVYHDKVSNVVSEEENRFMKWGNILEPIIRKEFADSTGFKVKRLNAVLQHPDHPFLLANIDGLVQHPEMGQGGLECKNASAYKAKEWVDEAVPEEYLTQCHHYMMVTGLPYWYIAALVGGNDFAYRLIMRDLEVEKYLFKIESEFWQMVQRREMPAVDGSDASVDLLNLLYPVGTDNELLTLPDEARLLCNAYQEASVAEKAAAARKKEAGNALRALMGEHVAASAGEYAVKWSNVNTTRLDQEALKEEMPDIYKGFLKESPSRRLTITTPKAA